MWIFVAGPVADIASSSSSMNGAQGRRTAFFMVLEHLYYLRR